MANYTVKGFVADTDLSINLKDIGSLTYPIGLAYPFNDRSSNALDNKITIELLSVYDAILNNIYSIIGTIAHDDSVNLKPTIGEKLSLIQQSISSVQNIAEAPDVIGAISGIGLYDNGYNGDIKSFNYNDESNINIQLYPISLLYKKGTAYSFENLDNLQVNLSIPTNDTSTYYLVVSLSSASLFSLTSNPLGNANNIEYINGYTPMPDAEYEATVNIPLSGTSIDLDGSGSVTLTSGDRVVVTNQTDPAENGIYIVSSGSWNRSSDVIENNKAIYVTSTSNLWIVTDSTLIELQNYRDVVNESTVFLLNSNLNNIYDLIKLQEEGNTLIPLFKFNFTWSSNAITKVNIDDLRNIIPSVSTINRRIISKIFMPANTIMVNSYEDVVALKCKTITSIKVSNIDDTQDNKIVFYKYGVNKVVMTDMFSISNLNDSITWYVTSTLVNDTAIAPVKGGYSVLNVNRDNMSELLVDVSQMLYFNVTSANPANDILLTVDWEDIAGNARTSVYKLNSDNTSTSFKGIVYPTKGGILFNDDIYAQVYSTTNTGTEFAQYSDIGSGIKSDNISDNAILNKHIVDNTILISKLNQTSMKSNFDAVNFIKTASVQVSLLDMSNFKSEFDANNYIKSNSILIDLLNAGDFRSNFDATEYIKSQSITYNEIADYTLPYTKFQTNTLTVSTLNQSNYKSYFDAHLYIKAESITNDELAQDSIEPVSLNQTEFKSNFAGHNYIKSESITKNEISNNTLTVDKLNMVDFKSNFNADYINVNNLIAPKSNAIATGISGAVYKVMTQFIPIGTIIAVHPKTGNLVDVYNSSSNTSGMWMLCDGSNVPAGTPLYAAGVTTTPQLGENTFLASTLSTNSTLSGTNSYNLTIANLPSHSHSISSLHISSVKVTGSVSTYSVSTFKSYAHTSIHYDSGWDADNNSMVIDEPITDHNLTHSHTLDMNSHSHNITGSIGYTGNGAAIDFASVIKKFTVQYYIRIQ